MAHLQAGLLCAHRDAKECELQAHELLCGALEPCCHRCAGAIWMRRHLSDDALLFQLTKMVPDVLSTLMRLNEDFVHALQQEQSGSVWTSEVSSNSCCARSHAQTRESCLMVGQRTHALQRLGLSWSRDGLDLQAHELVSVHVL